MGRQRFRDRATNDEYKRCQALGIVGRGCYAIAREYRIPLVLLLHFNEGEYQEDLDSSDADDDSFNEVFSKVFFFFFSSV